jgi:Skp family chaperone for outer membrane proteins
MGNNKVPVIIFGLLFVVVAGFCWLNVDKLMKNQTSLESSKKNLAREKSNYIEKKKALAKVSNLVGFRKKIADENGFYSSPGAVIDELNRLSKEDNGIGVKLESASEIDKSKLFLVTYLQNIPDLELAWNQSTKRIEQLQQEVNSLESSIKKAENDYQEEFNKTEKDINTWLKDIEDKKNNIQKDQVELEKTLLVAEKNRATEQERKLRTKEKLAQVHQKKRNLDRKNEEELNNLDERVKELQVAASGTSEIEELIREKPQAKFSPREQPDGEIVYVNDKNKTAYIDLGRSKGVLRGLTFNIFRYGKGGIRQEKGKAVVRKVQDNMSMVGIIELKDDLNPIVPGDFIINPVYDRNKVKYFVVAGTLDQYTPEQAIRRIERLGGKFEKAISAKTDFVILASGFKNDPKYKIAVERGIETMLETEFYSYTGDY